MDRKQKIQLLKDIEAGKKSVKSLLPRKWEVWYKTDLGYINTDPTQPTQKPTATLTETQYLERQRERRDFTSFITMDKRFRQRKAGNDSPLMFDLIYKKQYETRGKN